MTIVRKIITKADVGLGNVDNTSDANKPVPALVTQALADKSPIGHTHNKAEVGLGNVDNTADLSKPVSTAQAAAIAAAGLLSGSGAPLDSVGSPKQFYVDTVAARLYGPKGVNAWPATYFDLTQTALQVVTAPPVNTSAPTIAGLYQTGQTLTATIGGWTGAPAPTFAYQWMRGAAPTTPVDPTAPPVPLNPSTLTAITGASGLTYVTTSADLGLLIYVRVTATNSVASVAAYSAAAGKITAPADLTPVNTSLPTINGTTQVGATLTAANGAWTNSPTAYAYQWKRNGTNITGATASTYVVQSADTGAAISVQVTASNASGSASATSNSTSAILADALTTPVLLAAPVITGAAQETSTLSTTSASWSETLTAPTNTDAPVVSGSTVQGATLSASIGNWIANPAATYAYQWKRAGAVISGATSATYVIQAADLGAAITVSVTGSNSVGSNTATSLATATITAAPSATVPANISAPTISGTATQGQTLAASPGGWSGSPSSYTYQWKRGGTNISGATASTYTLQAADVGSTMSVAAVAINAAGSSSPATSASTSTVIAAAGVALTWTGLRQSPNNATAFPGDGATAVYAGGETYALANKPLDSGKIYFEVKIVQRTGHMEFGLTDPATVTTGNVADMPGGNNPGIGWNGFAEFIRVYQSWQFDYLFPVTGHTVRVAIDRTAGLVWFNDSSGNWNNNASANPATGAGGQTIPSVLGSIYPHIRIASDCATGDSATLRTLSSAWEFSAPSGFGQTSGT